MLQKNNVLNFFAINLLVLSLYVFSGYVALHFISSYNYMTAVWPPAGIALGAVLIWGTRSFPAILLGDFFISYLTGYMCYGSPFSLAMLISSSYISIGMFLRTLFAWGLITRWLGKRNPLTNSRDILLFAFIAGPLAGLIGASVSTLALQAQFHVTEHFGVYWFTWYLNDCLSSIIFAPLFLVLFAAPKPIWRARITQVLLPMMAAFAIVTIGYAYIDASEYRDIKSNFSALISDDLDTVESQLSEANEALRATAAHLSITPSIHQDGFPPFSKYLLLKSPFIQTIAWAPKIDDKQAFEANYHLSIKMGQNNAWVPTQMPPPYFPLMSAESNSRTENLLGLDISSQPFLKETLSSSLANNRTTMTSHPFSTSTDTPTNNSLLVRPVYHQGVFVGYAVAILNNDLMLHHILSHQQNFSHFILYDKNHSGAPLLSFDRPHDTPNNSKYTTPTIHSLTFRGSQWTVSATPSRSFVAKHYSWKVICIFELGLCFCAFMNIVLFILFAQKRIIQSEIKEKAIALHAEEVKNLLLLNSAGEGIFGLDAQGNTTFINPAATKMLGFTEEELLGNPLHDIIHHSNPNGTPYPHSQCPIFSSLKEGKPYRTKRDEVLWKKDGSKLWVEYTSTPLMTHRKHSGVVVVFNDISQRREYEIRLKRLAHSDTLTGLPNRFSFLETLTHAIEHTKKSRELLAVCFIDIDDFKKVNDATGHSDGDEVLKHIADTISLHLGQNDFFARLGGSDALTPISRSGCFARLGGDEFGLILQHAQTPHEIESLIASYIQLIRRPVVINNIERNISISVGISLYGKGGTTCEELIRNADIAMYRAKECGKSTYCFFDKKMHQKIQRRHDIETAMHKAIERQELTLHYQPQLDTLTSEITGVEALLRWHSYELGIVSPGEFIPIAESNGMIHSLGNWVLVGCLKEFKAIHDKYPNMDLSINISVRQLEDGGFIELLAQCLEQSQIPPENVCLEVTETALMKNTERWISIMQNLQTLGVRFALDDFGMGYSSMFYLRNAPISFIKIDQTFIRNVTSNPKDAAIVETIVQLSNSIGATVIAEGVEDYDQLCFLAAKGCERVQGFCLAKPMPLGKFTQWIHKYNSKLQEHSLASIIESIS